MLGGDGNDVMFGDANPLAAWLPRMVDFTTDVRLEVPAGQTGDGVEQADDVLDGGAGDDFLQGDGGSDLLYGGTGNDELWGDSDAGDVNTEVVKGQLWGNDYLDGEDGNDLLIGGGKDDVLLGGAGSDQLFGDQNSAALQGAMQGVDYLDGGEGNDLLVGGGRDDTLLGGAGDDELQGDASTTYVGGAFHGADVLDGGTGNDKLWGQGGADRLQGGDGNDFLYGDDGGAGLGLQFQGNDQLDGGAGDDQLDGEGGNDDLLGGAGIDKLYGGLGNDQLDGGLGNDFLFGEDGNDVLVSAHGVDYLDGGLGDDTYVLSNGDGQASVAGQALTRLQDASGNNTIVVNGEVSLHANRNFEGDLFLVADGKQFVIAKGLTGAIQNLVVNGQSFLMRDYVAANVTEAVSVTLYTGGSHQTLWGGAGNDQLITYDEPTSVMGGKGNDFIEMVGGGNRLTFRRGDGVDAVLVNPQTLNDPANALVLGEGIGRTDLALKLNPAGALVIEFPTLGSDQITISSSGPGGFLGLQKIQLADSTELDVLAELAARGIYPGKATEGTPRARPRRAGHGNRSRRARCRCAGRRAARCCWQ